VYEVNGYISLKKTTMVTTTISNPNLLIDFTNVTSHILKKKYATLLCELVTTGQLKFQVVSHKKQREDGITDFNRKRKRITVKIKDSVANSSCICWKMACLLHELVHVLHFWTSKKPVFKDDTHGKDWVNYVKETLIRGGLKKCAMELMSPMPMCIFKRYCIWCAPNGETVTRKVYKLPEVQEISTFGGNCLFCFTKDRTIFHLGKSEECRRRYAAKFGPTYKPKIIKLSLKEKRVQKRVGKYTGPSICKFCPAAADKLLLVHLRDNRNSTCTIQYMDHYNCNTVEDMRREIEKEKAKMRKRKQRGTKSVVAGN
jgi:hypothetical protein